MARVARTNLGPSRYRCLFNRDAPFLDVLKTPDPKVKRRHCTEEQAPSKSISYACGKESFTDAYALLASSGIPSTEGTSMSVIATPK